MTLVEMMLRLACAMSGWLVVYAYCLWLATLGVVGCGSDGDEFWRLLLGMAPLAVGAALLTWATGPLPELHRLLRWGLVPLLLLVPFALAAAWATFSTVNLEGGRICAAASPSGWHAWWAPVQFVSLGLVCALVARSWLLGRPRTADASHE